MNILLIFAAVIHCNWLNLKHGQKAWQFGGARKKIYDLRFMVWTHGSICTFHNAVRTCPSPILVFLETRGVKSTMDACDTFGWLKFVKLPLSVKIRLSTLTMMWAERHILLCQNCWQVSKVSQTPQTDCLFATEMVYRLKAMFLGLHKWNTIVCSQCL